MSYLYAVSVSVLLWILFVFGINQYSAKLKVEKYLPKLAKYYE